jgi:hypothetical protein
MAMHSVAAAVAATMAAVNSAATTTVLGAGRSRSKHGKAERSARGDGQQYRLPKHSVLLCDPWGIPLGIAMNRLSGPLVGRLLEKVQDPAKGHV